MHAAQYLLVPRKQMGATEKLRNAGEKKRNACVHEKNAQVYGLLAEERAGVEKGACKQSACPSPSGAKTVVVKFEAGVEEH